MTFLTIREAVALCAERGRAITGEGVTWAGLRHGFLHRDPNANHHWRVDKAGLLAWLSAAMAEKPDGWVTIKEAARLTGVSMPTLYYWSRNGRLDVLPCGARAGVAGRGFLVELKKVQEIIANGQGLVGGNND